MASQQPATLASLTTAITTLNLPTPHPAFLAPILVPGPSQRLPPLAALTATAKLRLLASDLTAPNILSPSTATFPPHISDATVPSKILGNDIPVQVLEIEDLSRGKWEQIEALEMERKGEMTKGREVIRTVPLPDEPSTASTQFPPNSTNQNQNQNQTKSSGPFKLLLEDYKGNRCYGFELKRVEKIAYPPEMCIGCKIILRRGAKVARGMVLLEPGYCVVLGGKIDGLNRGWREGRERGLRDVVEARGREEGA